MAVAEWLTVMWLTVVLLHVQDERLVDRACGNAGLEPLEP